MKRLQLQLVLLCCQLHFFGVQLLAMHSNDTDKVSLLAFKAGLTNGLDVLTSWNESTHFCEWKGITCGRRHPQRVSKLDLSNSDLAGSISPFIGNLSFLKTANLSSNKLYGEIPQSVSYLHRLQNVDFSRNSFIGRITIGLNNCSNLVSLNLSHNNFVSEIPSWLGSLSMLKYLCLNNNNLSGVIPLSLNNLSSLHDLDLFDNNLGGTIPEELSFLPMLQWFEVSVNHLSGTLPHSFFNQSSLFGIVVVDNELEGNLPVNIPINLPNIQYFVLSMNHFTGPIPTWISNLSSMYRIDLGENKFSGRIPPELGKLCPNSFNVELNELEVTNTTGWNFLRSLSNWSRLQELGLYNSLRGVFPNYITNLTQLRELSMGANYLSGSIPDEIGNLVNMDRLFLQENSLTGIIPESVGKLQQLHKLGLHDNILSGPLPSSIGNLTKLTILNLSNNNIQGHIPSNLANLQYLSYLDLSNNNIQGHIPSNLANLQDLIYLDLSNNFINGTLPNNIFNLSLPHLSLSNNSLTGKLPIKVCNMQLGHLDLSRNKFYGEPWKSLSQCESLEYLDLSINLFNGVISLFLKSKALLELNLSNNNFYGTIPQELSNIHGLQVMDLSHNNLFGTIPVFLENLSSLFVVDLSFNHLEGPVPTIGVFNNISGLFVNGNHGLCGGIPQLHLPMCPNVRNKKISSTLFKLLIVLPILVVFVISLLAIIYVLRQRMISREKEITKPMLLEEPYPKISYAELAKATYGFSVINLLGSGRYGSVYKCTLPFKYKQTSYHAVKVFNLEVQGASKTFLAECDALRTIRHRNLISIITCCSSTDFKGNDFKALVLDFMPKGSLERWLHGEGDRILRFIERLNIAVNVADAVDYLHNYCEPSIIHCDLKPSNILLNEDFTAHVSDFGFAKLLPNNTNMQLINSQSSLGIRGSIGYIAPEYGEGSPVSLQADVYSFGIIILELFTGMLPVDDIFKDGLTLHIFVEMAFRVNTISWTRI